MGDAAHRTTPVGGTGMNTAIHGAHNLGWKMAWVLRDWAGEDLLNSYEAERRPIAEVNVLRSLRPGPGSDGTGLAGDIGVRYPSAVLRSAAARHDENDDSSVDVGARARVGERAAHARIERVRADRMGPGRQLSTLDLFEGRLTLLTGRDGRVWAAAAAEVATTMPAGVSPEVVCVGQDIHDINGDLERRYQLGDTGAVLVRPDGYVAWRSDQRGAGQGVADQGDADPTAVLSAAIGSALGWPMERSVGLRRAG